jgi:beta-lactamase class A
VKPILFCWLALASCILGQPAVPSSRVERELERLSVVSGGTVGATAIHIESGRRISIRGSEGFPMASTVKVPLAIELLSRVDAGELKLDQMVDLKPTDLHPGSGTLSDLFVQPGVSLSVRNLMELMLLISDNSATDILLGLAGGGDTVTARMQKLKLPGIQVARPTLHLIADSGGVPIEPGAAVTLEQYSAKSRKVTPEERAAARARFELDPRDTSTPDGMALLLARLYKGELLKTETTALLLDIMDRCRTGNERLKGRLPAGTKVAHKTGTIATTASDVGIMTLPEDGGHVAIAVFVKQSSKTSADRDRAIAEIARSTYDYFFYTRPE